MRRHPITGQNKMHTGLDIAASSGTPVKAPASGTVSFAGWNGGYGNYVVIDHGNGLQTAYAHMSAINVKRGQRVTAGTQVGRVGSTGMSTGPHMHFEVKRNGQFVNPQGFLA
ncbi:Murein DD-endopeptidase MepM [compost metagenome]